MSDKVDPFSGRWVVPVRTELQVRPSEGSWGIVPRNRVAITTAGPKTFEMAKPAPWTALAKCLQGDEPWENYAGRVEPSAAAAKLLCSGCPVKDECLDSALTEEGDVRPVFRAGVRGGLTPGERYELMVGKTKCPEGHPHIEFAIRKATGWVCGECLRLYRLGLVTCTCGVEMTRGNVYTHRKRKGCPPGPLPVTA